MNSAVEPRTYTVPEIAAALRLHATTVRLHLESGHIPGGKKIGNQWHVERTTFDMWLRRESR